ncbi:MAG: hypothetical protein ACO3EH_00365 [Ilumatobacteraceae bacterium]
MKLTKLQRSLVATISSKPVLIEGAAFIRSLRTARQIWEKTKGTQCEISYAASRGVIVLWAKNSQVGREVSRAVDLVGPGHLALLGVQHDVIVRN